MRDENENGKIYRIVIDSAQLLAGISKPILEHPAIVIPHLNDPYFICIRKFLAETDLNITTPQLMRIAPPRTNDSALMDEVIKNYGKSPKKIREFNQCRLYLRVIYISDLANGAGTAIHPHALSNNYRDYVGQTKWTFPRQEMPPHKSWKTWKQVIRSIYLRSKTGRLTDLRLTRPLGAWTNDGHTQWKWLVSPTERLAYKRDATDELDAFPMIRNKLQSRTPSMHLEYGNELPTDVMPATVIQTSESTTLSYYEPPQYGLRRNQRTTGHELPIVNCTYRIRFKEVDTSNCDAWAKALLQNAKLLAHVQETTARQRMLLTKTTLAVHVTQSGKEMGFGWAMAVDQTILATGSGTMPKGIERTTQRQSGLAGIYAGIHTARSIVHGTWTSHDPELNIVCTHKGTADYMTRICQRTYKQRAPLHDLFTPTKRILHALQRRRVTVKHIETSEDNELEQTVAKATTMAQQHWNREEAYDSPEQSPCTQTMATLCHKGIAISKNYERIIRLAVHKPQHMEYTREKFGWTNETYENINWEAFAFVTGRLNINRRTRQSKFNHRWLPIGSRRKIIDNLAPEKCPCCDEPDEETHDHILTCQAASRHDVRTEFLESYGRLLEKLKAPNLMRTVILTSIDEWNKDQSYTCPITQDIRRDRALHEAIRAQNEIGWDQFQRGYIAKSFQYCYNNHCHDRPMNDYESNKWTILTINAVFEHFEQQWEKRNQAIHGHDDASQKAAERQHLLRTVRALYRLKDKLEPHDQRLLHRQEERYATYRPSEILLWIRTVQPTILRLLDITTLPDDDPNNDDPPPSDTPG
jgi:hypothetical protein